MPGRGTWGSTKVSQRQKGQDEAQATIAFIGISVGKSRQGRMNC